jgi:hypothetical protein
VGREARAREAEAERLRREQMVGGETPVLIQPKDTGKTRRRRVKRGSFMEIPKGTRPLKGAEIDDAFERMRGAK